MNKSKIIISMKENNREIEVSCACPKGTNEEMTALSNHIATRLPGPVYKAVQEFFTKKKESKNVSVH